MYFFANAVLYIQRVALFKIICGMGQTVASVIRQRYGPVALGTGQPGHGLTSGVRNQSVAFRMSQWCHGATSGATDQPVASCAKQLRHGTANAAMHQSVAFWTSRWRHGDASGVRIQPVASWSSQSPAALWTSQWRAPAVVWGNDRVSFACVMLCNVFFISQLRFVNACLKQY